MKPIRWTGKAGDQSWYSARNWTAGVPGAGADVLFNDGGTWALSIRGADPQLGKLTINGDKLGIDNGRIDLNAAPARQGATVDLAIGRGGSLALTNDAILAATNTVQVGAVQGGTLTSGTLAVGAYGGGWSSEVNVFDGLFSVSGTSAHWSGAGSGAGASFLVQVAGQSGAAVLVSGGGALGAGASGFSDLSIGGGGTGLVTVTDPGSVLSMEYIRLGNGGTGTLVVANLATVDTSVLSIGDQGDGVVQVSSGATLSASAGIGVGSTLQPVNSVLEVTNHGSVYAGTNGMVLEQGTLKLDPTAVVFGGIVSLGGHIEAVAQAGAQAGAAGGVVRLGQGMAFGSLDGSQFGSISTVFSAAGVRLELDGRVTTDFSGPVLQVGAGSVVLTNATNQIGTLALAGGALTIAATGADGHGTLSFLNAYSPTAQTDSELVVPAGVHLTDVLTGFEFGSRVDLQGFAFGTGVSDSLLNGTLTLNDASGSTSLVVSGTYSAGQFTFAKDAGGGTVISFHQ